MSWRRSLIRNFVLILEEDLGCYSRNRQARRERGKEQDNLVHRIVLSPEYRMFINTSQKLDIQ